MPNKMNAAEIVRVAIIWAEESMCEMIHGCSHDDPYRKQVQDLLKQMRTYRNRRFGKPRDPFEGGKLLGLDELRKLPPTVL